MEKKEADWARREGEEKSEFPPFFYSFLFFYFKTIFKSFQKHLRLF